MLAECAEHHLLHDYYRALWARLIKKYEEEHASQVQNCR